MLNIAITADPELPVPPGLYGGIERVIAMLINSYAAQGHQVSLFAHPGSVTEAKLHPYPGKTNNKLDALKNAALINKTVFKSQYSIIHNFGRLAYILPQLPLAIPKLMSYQREPTISQVKRAYSLSKKNTLHFTGCSDYISRQIAPYAPATTIYNGVDKAKYQLTKVIGDDAPLIFLGRIEPVKGTHLAIQIAKKAGKKLIIAGNIPAEHRDYFNELIQPFLDEDITYTGAVNDEQKNKLLGQAAALLMPIQWDEPFGIVMIEAMACGTPVIGFKKGAVPEVVLHDVNGYYGNTVEELVSYVKCIKNISREMVRSIFEERFSSTVIADNYLKLYRQLIDKAS
jgi:glycosyltransferase involved in cell wall biosynthesis